MVGFIGLSCRLEGASVLLDRCLDCGEDGVSFGLVVSQERRFDLLNGLLEPRLDGSWKDDGGLMGEGRGRHDRNALLSPECKAKPPLILRIRLEGS